MFIFHLIFERKILRKLKTWFDCLLLDSSLFLLVSFLFLKTQTRLKAESCQIRWMLDNEKRGRGKRKIKHYKLKLKKIFFAHPKDNWFKHKRVRARKRKKRMGKGLRGGQMKRRLIQQEKNFGSISEAKKIKLSNWIAKRRLETLKNE